MPSLVLPTVSVRASFLAMIDELGDGQHGDGGDTGAGRDVATWKPRWRTPEGFAAHVAALRAQADPRLRDLPGRVPATIWWWVEGDEHLGRIALRHGLTEQLRRVGGHVGYDVRLSARRHGHATAMLAALLPRAHEMGIDPVLITCNVDNVGSRRVIEANGGIFDSELDGKLRFWLPTG